jgi:histone H3/H4
MAVQNKSGEKEPLGVDDLVIQTAMAFGHGAGGVNVTAKASRLLRAFFKPRFKDHLKHYRQHRLAMLAYATGLGWYAQTLARTKGRVTVGASDVRIAIDKMPCPLLPPVFELLEKLRAQG